MNKKKIAGIILAAGKGKRIGLLDANKVTLSVSGKPLIVENATLLKALGVDPVCIVVGFAKESVMKLFSTGGVVFAKQTDQLGTAHAAIAGVEALPVQVQHVLILNGDGVYPFEVIENLIHSYQENEYSCMFLSVKLGNPLGIGRIVRDENGEVASIIEEKDASDSIRKIREVNAGCYIGRMDFFKKYLSQIDKSPITGEYYLTDIISLAYKNNEKIHTVKWGDYPWNGINTIEDLKRAQN